MAVNRGFLYAGAKNVVFTLFKVLDKPSSELTQNLFAHILKGDDFVTALRKAKLQLIEQDGIDPKSWSWFCIIGGQLILNLHTPPILSSNLIQCIADLPQRTIFHRFHQFLKQVSILYSHLL